VVWTWPLAGPHARRGQRRRTGRDGPLADGRRRSTPRQGVGAGAVRARRPVAGRVRADRGQDPRPGGAGDRYGPWRSRSSKHPRWPSGGSTYHRRQRPTSADGHRTTAAGPTCEALRPLQAVLLVHSGATVPEFQRLPSCRRRVRSDRTARRVPGQDHASDASAECETAGVDHAAGAVRSPACGGFSPRGTGPQHPGRNLVGLRCPVLDRQAAQHSGSDADTKAPRAGQATGRPPTQPAGGAAIRVDRDAPPSCGGTREHGLIERSSLASVID
jgi:hypothetical protein